jgi:hypothetical protein
MKVETVLVQIERPRGAFRGRVCEGCYVVEDGVLTMTDREGKPVLDDRGYPYTHKGDNPETIAGRLTHKLRSALRGRNAQVQGFDSKIEYFNRGKI